MGKLTTPAKREIIEDFAKEIADRKETGPKPTMDVINFRDDVRVGREREVYLLPTGLLRYRKDNGRITSDVLSYEKQHRPIDEKTDEGQAAIRGFLEQKDRERTEELKRSIFHDAQRSPAIVTCDGFLINGNRRKMAIEVLYEETQDVRFSTMKVVILPGKDDEGGTPTILEIEEIENRCQLQSDGRADYTSFDRALSMRRKELHGMSLERQLKDDPTYAHLSEKEFKKAVEDDRKKYLLPLKCIDRYLNHLKRDGLYETVSSGIGDKEGRWQAFHDYYN